MLSRTISATSLSLDPRQPLTAPDVSPATIRRWKNSTKMMIGMVITTAAAAIGPVGAVNWELPLKKPSAAGAVRALIVEVNEIAKMKSFQQNRNTRIAVVTMPGAASGAMTLVKAWNGVAPSIFAAFSSSHGISRKKAARM